VTNRRKGPITKTKKWMGNITIDLREIRWCGMDRINVTQDRKQ
jgi:hypothetical protein